VIADFKAATIRAEAGIRLWKFMRLTVFIASVSLLSNVRTDAYGGSLKTIRLTLEVLEAVQSEWPDLPLFVRISATDWADGGWNAEESVQLLYS
jgi:2,4-dienoyl-CoA reductase-like NADH-dependent reductase (Old Yellow Enzyme family)